MADPNRSSHRYGERHHERNTGEIEHDTMGGERMIAEPPGHQSRDLKGPYLEQMLQAGRDAVADHLAQSGSIKGGPAPRLPGAVMQFGQPDPSDQRDDDKDANQSGG